MERTRFFRRPVVWIILVIIGAIALSSFFTSGPSYHKVDTSVALQQLNQTGGIKKAVFKDKEQTLQLDLQNRAKFGDTDTDKIQAQFPYEVGDDIWNDVLEAQGAGRIQGPVNTEVSEDSVFLTLLVNLLPIACW
jgi:cell division protease FtsH